jgi:melibiase-like protein
MRRGLNAVVAAALLVATFATNAGAAKPDGAHGCTWLAGDFHVHTVYSHDSFGGPLYDDEDETQDAYTTGWTVAEEGALATSRGLDFVAITDHNNVRSQSDPGWELWKSRGLTLVPGYENSIGGHAQMIGATKVYDNHAGPPAVADQLRADGGAFQINHPADGKWEDAQGNYLFPEFYPDTVEVWNIGVWAYEPPAPATEDHEYAPRFYDRFLDQGAHVAATGGSDSHWRSTAAIQGPGQPTTWVCAAANSVPAILAGVKAGRTTISNEPPAYQGPFAKLEADADGDGTFEATVGDTVVSGSRIRASVEGAPGAVLRLVTNGSQILTEVPVDSPSFAHTFTVPESSTWVRAEVYYRDAGEQRESLQPQCDAAGGVSGLFGDEYENVAYCRSRLAVVAMTSPVYLQSTGAATTITYTGDTSVRYGSSAALSARLVDASGSPIGGAAVVFRLGEQSYTATTDAAGVASIRAQTTPGPGTYELITRYAGSESNGPAEDRDSFTVQKGPKPSPRALPADELSSGDVYARVDGTDIVLGNDLVERSWDASAFATTSMTDKRGTPKTWSADRPDFELLVGAARVPSDLFSVADVSLEDLGRGIRATMHLTAPGIDATRVAEAYEGIAGFRTQTTLRPTAPLALRGASFEEAAVGSEVSATIHAFRAGADWRDPGYEGPQFTLGDAHPGTWRDSRTAGRGENLAGPAQWISVAGGDRSLFMVMERNDWPSSRAAYQDGIASLDADFSRDVIILGPLEENGHIENPSDGPGRHHAVAPGASFELPAAFTGFGNGAGDEAWQFYKYLTERRLEPYDKDVTFNSNGTDSNAISTGAKDDMNYEKILQVAPIAKRLGVDTFILDDGWQAISGDWYPDCPDHPEPRWDGTATSKFRPRFPDCTFQAVRDAIAPMKLGLWMNPMQFHPDSETFKAHPEWACAPVGDATALANTADKEGSSNEAGIGTWGPDAIPHIESRIREAIEEWGVRYFKFDFLVWLDCAGQGDLYDYQDRFVGMLDRLQGDYPHVTFQTDETNDYRLFPFLSVARGPSWFQNGTPEPNVLLHNLWNLSPFVPAWSLGQHFLGGNAFRRYPVDTLMAAALPSHMTYFSDLTALPSDVVDRARIWTDFYRAHRDLLAGMTYPLLDDPLGKGWTALQSWNPETASGALYAFRQQDSSPTKSIALQNVPPGRTFDLVEAPTGTKVGTVTSAQLSNGITITLPNTDTAKVLLVVPTS